MLIEKFLLGVSLGIPFGPVTCEMVKRGLHGGFLPAIKIRITSLIGHAICLVAASFSVNFLQSNKFTLALLSLFSSIFLAFIGIKSILKKVNLEQEKNIQNKNIFSTGIALSLANPVSITFWLGLFSYGSTTGPELNSYYSMAINSIILIGVLAWGTILSLALALGKKFITNNTLQALTKASGVIILGYGCYYTVSVLKYLYNLV